MSKERVNTTFKTPLLNDCTNHLALQLEQCSVKNEPQQKNVNLVYETPLTDIVTYEFVRGYN